MTATPLLLGLPSKGRLKDQAEAWLADCGLGLQIQGGERGYRGVLTGAPGVETPLLASSEIAAFLAISDRPAAALAQVRALAEGPGLERALQAWWLRLERLVEEGVPPALQRLSPAFGRAFGYYDGFLFEVRSSALDAERPVAAGGRYDGLMPRLGAKARAGAVGCMVRPWRAYAQGEPS